MKNALLLYNKVILITGSNGQLGQSLSLKLLKNGAYVYLTDIHPKISHEFKEKMHDQQLTSFDYLQMDVTSESSIKDVLGSVTSDVEILINNAGIVEPFTPFEERTEKELDLAWAVNLKGPILCSKFFSQKMIHHKKGKIINIGSIYGIVSPDKKIYGDSGRNSSEIYGATKAGVIQFTKYLATHLAEHNIQVNCVSPGGIFNHQTKDFVDHYTRKTPLHRMATTEDISGMVAFLSSDEATYITGQNIVIDGGFTAW